MCELPRGNNDWLLILPSPGQLLFIIIFTFTFIFTFIFTFTFILILILIAIYIFIFIFIFIFILINFIIPIIMFMIISIIVIIFTFILVLSSSSSSSSSSFCVKLSYKQTTPAKKTFLYLEQGDEPTGAFDCTYTYKKVGEISIDELEGRREILIVGICMAMPQHTKDEAIPNPKLKQGSEELTSMVISGAVTRCSV